MNILVLNGSPKIDGKISQICDVIINESKMFEHQPQILNLSLLNIKDCIGCMKCQEAGACVIRDDDIGIVEQTILKSDCLILASPTHWGNMSGIMLRTFERLFGFLIQEQKQGFPKAINAKGKKVILVTTCSTPWPFNYIFNQSRSCLNRIREICKYSKMKIIGKIVLPGTIDMQEIPQRHLFKAKKIAGKI